MQLLRFISFISQAKYGINFIEELAPAVGVGTSDRTVGIIADFPWGPYEPTEVKSVSELFSTFAPAAFESGGEYMSMYAMVDKAFAGPVTIKRVEATGALASASTFADENATGSVTVTAKYKGVKGNDITIEWVDGTTPASQASAIVRVGAQYARTYTDVVSGTTVTDPGDPFVTFTAAGTIALRPETAVAAALTGGTDGTAVATDWTGTAGTMTGVRAFRATTAKTSVLIGADVPNAFVSAFNTALEAVVEEVRNFGVASVAVGQTAAQFEAAAAAVRSDRLAFYVPRVKVVDSLDDPTAEVTVDPNAFIAAMLVLVDPEISIAGKDARGLLSAITGLETDFSQEEVYALRDAGVNVIVPHNDGYRLFGSRTTSLVEQELDISRRRMTDFIIESLYDIGIDYLEEPLDVNVVTRSLGPTSRGLVARIQTFLAGLKTASRIADFDLNPFIGEASDIALGRFPIEVRVQIYAPMQELVILTTVGSSVTFEVQ